MTGIIAAMDIEERGLRALMECTETHRAGGIDFTVGRIGAEQVVTAVCGMGKVFAAMCTQTMILEFAPDVIINTGVAGTLSPQLHIGDAAVAADLVQHDLDTSAIGNPVGFMPELGISNIPADEKTTALLMEGAAECGVKSLRGTIASGDKFMSDRGEKELLVRRFNAIACEMEGAAIAQVCRVNGTPFGVLRAISDEADGGAADDFAAFAAQAAEKTVNILKYFVERKSLI